MADQEFIIYRGDQAPALSLGNETCSRQASISLVYDDDGVRGDFGRIQRVVANSDMVYEYVRLKYNTDFDFETGGETTLGGISLIAGDRVYLDGQTTSSENGIYEVETGEWTFIKAVDDDVFVDLGARASDDEDGDLTRDIIIYNPTLDFETVGFYSIYYYIVNSIGILSQAYRKVMVVSSADASIVPTNAYKITHYEIAANADSDLFT